MTETPPELSSAPWLTIVGLGEDGLDGLCAASRQALAGAELVIGPPRHLGLLRGLNARTCEWPAPFAAGVARVLERRGRPTVMLASGDPFWFGAGTSVTRHLPREEWVAYPAPSTFSLVAAQLGWAMQDCTCLALHAAPLERLRPHLAKGRRVIALVRDGEAVPALATYLCDQGFGATRVHVLEALGGPRARIREAQAETLELDAIASPVAVALELEGQGPALPVTAGRADTFFEHDGQITKSPVRALTLAALAPRPGERLWDIGAGSGSVAIEWLLAHPANQALAIEADPVRAERARANARNLGVDRLEVLEARVPSGLTSCDLPRPDAIFIGGGLSHELLEGLCARVPSGTRLVANAVTLESEALLAQWQALRGGDLLRIELSRSTPLGSRRGWRASYPIVQWSLVL